MGGELSDGTHSKRKSTSIQFCRNYSLHTALPNENIRLLKAPGQYITQYSTPALLYAVFLKQGHVIELHWERIFWEREKKLWALMTTRGKRWLDFHHQRKERAEEASRYSGKAPAHEAREAKTRDGLNELFKRAVMTPAKTSLEVCCCCFVQSRLFAGLLLESKQTESVKRQSRRVSFRPHIAPVCVKHVSVSTCLLYFQGESNPPVRD